MNENPHLSTKPGQVQSASDVVSGKLARNSRCETSQLAARPLDDDLSLHIEILPGIADRTVVVSEHRHGSLVDEIHDRRHRPVRIGSISYVVTEEHDSLRTMIARLREASAERLPVRMNVRENCN